MKIKGLEDVGGIHSSRRVDIRRKRKKLLELEAELKVNGGKKTERAIALMRASGQPRPEDVSPEVWQSAKEDISALDVRMLQQISLGGTPASVAKMNGHSLSYINRLIKSETGKAKLEALYSGIYQEEAKRAIEEILPVAIKTAFQIMIDDKTKANVRSENAFRFMDRALGRPIQQVEMTHDLAKRVYRALDEQMKVARPVESEQSHVKSDPSLIEIKPSESAAAEDVAPNKDPIDSWVEENLK